MLGGAPDISLGQKYLTTADPFDPNYNTPDQHRDLKKLTCPSIYVVLYLFAVQSKSGAFEKEKEASESPGDVADCSTRLQPGQQQQQNNATTARGRPALPVAPRSGVT